MIARVIVVLRLELGDERIAANTRRHRERAEVIERARCRSGAM